MPRIKEQILNDLRRVENELSPENLTWDGERPRSEVNKAARKLEAERKALVSELGYEPSFKEIYGD